MQRPSVILKDLSAKPIIIKNLKKGQKRQGYVPILFGPQSKGKIYYGKNCLPFK